MPTTVLLMLVSMFAMYVLLGWIFTVWRLRVRKFSYDERMRALELRQPLPPEPLRNDRNPFLPPLLLTGFGLAFLGIGYLTGGVDGAGFAGTGLVALCLGVAWGLANWFNRANQARREEMAQRQGEAYLEALRAVAAKSPPVPPTPPMPPRSTVDI